MVDGERRFNVDEPTQCLEDENIVNIITIRGKVKKITLDIDLMNSNVSNNWQNNSDCYHHSGHFDHRVHSSLHDLTDVTTTTLTTT